MKVVVIGAGEVGRNISDILSKEGNDLIIIDKDEARLKTVTETLDVQTITGSGSSPRILKKAKLDQAEMVIAVTDSDETNIVACLIASTQSKVPFKIARIRMPDLDQNSVIFDKNHLKIDLCINPEREAVNKAISIMDYSGASEIIDFAEGRIKMVAFSIDRSCAAVGKNLIELNNLYGGDILIASIIRSNELIIPKGNSTIRAKDYIFAFAETKNVRTLLKFFGKDTEPVQRVFILGGGNTSLMLAEQLEVKGISTKIIEKRQDRCEMLSERLNKAVCLLGDGTSQDLLKEENIQEADYFIAVTGDEEANILSALLAKQLGAKRAICLINKVDYSHLIPIIGIDGVMNPRQATIGKILHFIRKGKIISATPLSDEKAEAVEFIALETSEITGKPLKNIKFPKGTIIGAIMRNNRVIIPGGDTMILPDDRVILVTLRSAISQIEKILTVKLDYF
ncbi:MAG: Trk system potassium transporter TrkA [Syntrophales bacterium]|jgi:trk system potassium uptake protein TrkA|nr:Trk system potassium transporter TrkA [Syntrophales bacterium]MDY0043643.1 Trk system potassium transporter TrkA [Syntrophales bacterium]